MLLAVVRETCDKMFQLVRYGRWLKNLKKSQSNLLLGFYISSTTTTTAARNESNPSRSSPPPIRVSLTESAGRGVFATRAIGAGELIHTAKPIVSHPSLSSTTSVCYLCLKSFRNRITSEAQGVSFCSQECEEQSKVFYEVEKQADWSAYREYCCTQGLKYPLLAKRLACMVTCGVANAESLDILQPAILSPEMILQMEKEFTLLRSAFEEANVTDEQMACILCVCQRFILGFFLSDFLFTFSMPKILEFETSVIFDLIVLTKQWYVGVLARIRINAFRIELAGGLYDYQDLLSSAAALVEAEAAVGNAVYMLPSFYNHDCGKLFLFSSCIKYRLLVRVPSYIVSVPLVYLVILLADPNAHIVWIENSDARVKALRDIEAGEELRICYIDASMDHDARQTLLYEGFGFRCHCLRCLSGD
ncbi:hypothetical protein RHGRI_006205 [Rhododendron griersonianum]|uniref:SET domain-containing protein n=1 Tax=Rhododendron griersonianum TaxID=479676 RepID=A0AAV6KS83_9ERIC|nr:hypothetical protein RHGRI_006205 [Rhododendron griersonianum]